MARMKAHTAKVERSEEKRSPIPLRSQMPKTNSNGGSRWANGLTAQGGSIWYESTPMANIESDVFTEATDQGMPACGFSFA